MALFAIYPGHAYYASYLSLRYSVLRAPLGLPVGSEQDPTDTDSTTIHFVWMHGDTAVGGVQLQATDAAEVARVRFMAVDPAHQKTGIGRQLLAAIFGVSAEQGYSKLSLYARESAIAFYLKADFELKEEVAPFHGIRHWHMTLDI